MFSTASLKINIVYVSHILPGLEHISLGYISHLKILFKERADNSQSTNIHSLMRIAIVRSRTLNLCFRFMGLETNGDINFGAL